MPFSVETYDGTYLEGITALYNAETAFEPHIAPLTPERFVELVEQKSYFDPMGLLLAIEGGQVVGWIHACIAPGSEAHHDPERRIPRIRMLIYPRDRLKVGHALVAEATDWLRQSAREGVMESRPYVQEPFLAMHAQVGYPFYRGLWLGGEPMCPATMPHIHLAFEVGGYKNTQESVCMVREMDAPPKEHRAEADLEFVELAAEMEHEPMRESWIGFEPMRIRAFARGEEAGSIGWVMLSHVADRLGAPCANIWGLGVPEPYRRKGIASALVSRVMVRSYALGARFASVGTQLWNAPAHGVYTKLGFRSHCIVVGRTLERPMKQDA